MSNGPKIPEGWGVVDYGKQESIENKKLVQRARAALIEFDAVVSSAPEDWATLIQNSEPLTDDDKANMATQQTEVLVEELEFYVYQWNSGEVMTSLGQSDAAQPQYVQAVTAVLRERFPDEKVD